MTSDTRAVDREGYLGGTPTMADVIGWVFTVPTIMGALTICPYMQVAVVPKFATMFRSLGAHLPAITIFVLGQGWWFFTLMPIAIALASTAWLVRSRGPVGKIAVTFVANQAIIGVVAIGVVALEYPVLELQKTLSG